jgi:putative heme-binding domain-containing protein
VIPHLFHVVPGGIYHRQGGQHFNPYVYSDIQTIADHRHRSAHGGARVYQSDAFPAAQRGRVFMANIHEHAVLSDVLARAGSGFSARHGEDFLVANNAHWIGFSLEVGPDGAIYVLDWHDSDICGNSVQHKQTGRIFRVAPTTSMAAAWNGRYGDLGGMSDRDLVALQSSPSDWHARRARVILQGRAARHALAPETHAALRSLFRDHPAPDIRLRAMWALHVTGGWTPAGLAEALRDRDEYVRAWAIQLITEDGPPPSDVGATFARMARDDRSAVVRLYLASALQRLDPAGRWGIADGLMAHAGDARDPNLPTMLWLGLEPLVPRDPAIALDHASRSRMPQIARFTARRAVDAGAIEPLVTAIGRTPSTITSLLEGLRDGLEGRFDLAAPPNWAEVFERLRRAGAATSALATDISRRFDDTESARRNLASIRGRTESIDERRRAIHALAAQRRPELVPELAAAIDDPLLRIEAIRAVAAFDDDGLGKLVVSRYPAFDRTAQTEAIHALATRPRYARMLTDALADGTIPKRDVPTYAARQLRRLVGVRFAEVWGPVESSTVEDRTLARYRSLLTDRAVAAASKESGRMIFRQACGACHTMYGEGGVLGPDLTGSNRGNLDYLLANVLDPNRDVPEAYRMVVVTTRDGRTFSGSVINETDRLLTLRIVGQDPVAVATADIQSREVTALSLMPSGLLEALTDREVTDLVAYLKTVE